MEKDQPVCAPFARERGCLSNAVLVERTEVQTGSSDIGLSQKAAFCLLLPENSHGKKATPVQGLFAHPGFQPNHRVFMTMRTLNYQVKLLGMAQESAWWL